ncbi:MAG: hypothetical protein IPM63_06350 [Acidobacteriota bacterium]|nr:MAG: hypothetical protein IPM63_06350 [Acidobacteriota bacterium]
MVGYLEISFYCLPEKSTASFWATEVSREAGMAAWSAGSNFQRTDPADQCVRHMMYRATALKEGGIQITYNMIKHMQNALVGFLLTFAVAFGACSESQTSKAVAFATTLQASLKAFEAERKDTQDSVVEAKEVIDELLVPTTPEGVAVTSERWEQAAEELSARIQGLKKSFESLTEDSRTYFSKLDEETSGIKNPVLRSATEQKNRKLHIEWSAAQMAAATSLGKLTNLESGADDIGRVIRTGAMRSLLKSNTEELKKIAAEAEMALQDLSRLTAEGQELLNFTE